MYFKASISRHRKPALILPSSFCFEMFTRPLACCRCDQFLLLYEVTVKICLFLSVKTALSCLYGEKISLQNMSDFFVRVVRKLLLDGGMYLEYFDASAHSSSCHLRG